MRVGGVLAGLAAAFAGGVCCSPEAPHTVVPAPPVERAWVPTPTALVRTAWEAAWSGDLEILSPGADWDVYLWSGWSVPESGPEKVGTSETPFVWSLGEASRVRIPLSSPVQIHHTALRDTLAVGEAIDIRAV